MVKISKVETVRNIKLLLAYDGTAYKGWQKTPMGPTIEETLETVLQQILQHPVALQAASRTDAGVHAEEQVVNFTTTKTVDKLQHSLNALLPKDIVVRSVEEVLPSFHPTLHCKSKTYHYWVCTGTFQMPRHRFYSWHVPYAVDLPRMRKAAESFLGEHDFHAFTNAKKNETYSSTLRQVDELTIDAFDQRLRFTLRGQHFLFRMVRNLVGTLLYVGQGKLALEEIPLILQKGDRTLAGVTAPAHGLHLMRVDY